jgi:hypothetical protein
MMSLLVIISLAVLLSMTTAFRRIESANRVLVLGTAQTLLFGASLVLAALGDRLDGGWAVSLSVLCIAWAMFGGGAVVGAVMVLAQKGGLEMPTASLPATIWIGIAERAAITISLALGLKEFAAVVLGVKALGQYQGADNHLPAARVLGTLVSAIWALCCFSIYFVAARP